MKAGDTRARNSSVPVYCTCTYWQCATGNKFQIELNLKFKSLSSWLPLTAMPFTVLFLDHTDRPERTHIVFFTITSSLT